MMHLAPKQKVVQPWLYHVAPPSLTALFFVAGNFNDCSLKELAETMNVFVQDLVMFCESA